IIRSNKNEKIEEKNKSEIYQINGGEFSETNSLKLAELRDKCIQDRSPMNMNLLNILKFNTPRKKGKLTNFEIPANFDLIQGCQKTMSTAASATIVTTSAVFTNVNFFF
ncbi:hypothetical protein L9F63_018972, partial [Diploptera punctata]